MADTLQQEEFTYLIENFADGLQSNVPYAQRPSNGLVAAKNARITRRGTVTRRHVYDERGYFALNVIGYIVNMTVASSSTQRLLFVATSNTATGLTTVRTFDNSTWAASSQTFSYNVLDDQLLLTDAAFVRETDGTEYVYYANPDGNAIKYTIAHPPVGTSLSGATNTNPPANCRYLINHLNRLWMAGKNDSKRNVVYFSALEGTDTSVPGIEDFDQTTNILLLPTPYGERITALFPYKDNMIIIGTENRIFVLAVGTSQSPLDWEIRTVTNDFGIIGKWCMAQVNDDVLFIDTTQRIRSMNMVLSGSSRSEKFVSFPIDNNIQGGSTLTIANSSAIFFDDYYTLYNWSRDKTYSLDTTNYSWAGEWTFRDNNGSIYDPICAVKSAPFGSGNLLNLKPDLYIGALRSSDVRGAVLRREALTTTSSAADEIPQGSTAEAQEFVVQTNDLDFGFPHQEKFIKWIEIECYVQTASNGASRSFAVEGRKDFNASWTNLGTFNYGTGSEFVRSKFNCKSLGRGRTFGFRFRKTDTGSPPEIIRCWIQGQAFEVKDN